jgi:hypothetical protein
LFTAASYEVQSSVPVALFGEFVKLLGENTQISVTNDNVVSLSLIAKEFCLDELSSECSTLLSTLDPLGTLESIRIISCRISELEGRLSSPPVIREVEERLSDHERQLETLFSFVSTTGTDISALHSRFDTLSTSFHGLEQNLAKIESLPLRFNQLNDSFQCLQSDLGSVRSSSVVPSASPSPSASTPSGSAGGVQFPFRKSAFGTETALEGIISYLTRKYVGNVHDAGVISITSSSVERDNPKYAPKNVADFTGETFFGTKDLADSWICFDFKGMRVIPTHYTMVTFHDIKGEWGAQHPRSWILEGWNDRSQWVVLDARSNISLLDGPDRTATFDVSNAIQCRFIRLRNTGLSASGHFSLELYAFEVFGTLFL